MIEATSLTAASPFAGAALGAIPRGIASPSAAPPGLQGFTAMVREASSTALATIREGDVMAQKAMTGEVSTQKVVEAILSMESSVRTIVTIRDKMVEAYQEILRMPV
jgi:flagellar hook-basal body complex protein FliE